MRWIENLETSTKFLADPSRCVHIGDRECDIYELFCKAAEMGTHFLVRVTAGRGRRGRLAGDGDHTVEDEMEKSPVQGIHQIEVRDAKGKVEEVALEIKYHTLQVMPPIGKQKHYPPLTLTVIHAQEHEAPKDRERIDWRLFTDLSVESLESAIEKLQWYAQRWKIETFHKILKSGCKAEESKLRTAERLANLISMFCVIGWRIFWMTMLNRSTQNAPAKTALTELEMRLLDALVKTAPSVSQNSSLGRPI